MTSPSEETAQAAVVIGLLTTELVRLTLRVNDLLVANNTYLERARKAEADARLAQMTLRSQAVVNGCFVPSRTPMDQRR